MREITFNIKIIRRFSLVLECSSSRNIVLHTIPRKESLLWHENYFFQHSNIFWLSQRNIPLLQKSLHCILLAYNLRIYDCVVVVTSLTLLVLDWSICRRHYISLGDKDLRLTSSTVAMIFQSQKMGFQLNHNLISPKWFAVWILRLMSKGFFSCRASLRFLLCSDMCIHPLIGPIIDTSWTVEPVDVEWRLEEWHALRLVLKFL